MEPITLLALGTAAVFLLRGKKKKKVVTDGPTPTPTTPRPTVRPGMVRLNAAAAGGTIVFTPSKDARVSLDGNEAGIVVEKLPVDVLVSVPANFAPLKVNELRGAKLIAGEDGKTLDLQFRVTEYQTRAEGSFSINLHAEVTGAAIVTGPLWVSVVAPAAKKGVSTKLYEGDSGVWHFGGYIDGVLKITDGPFASEAAAGVAAKTWADAQK